MHEQSLVRNLLRQVDKIRRQHDADRLTEVRVAIGSLSGVEPLLLTSAFEMLKPAATAANAKLVIDEVRLLAECESCVKRFEVNGYVFRCPTCDGNVRVKSGDECVLVSISFPDDAAEHKRTFDPQSSTK